MINVLCYSKASEVYDATFSNSYSENALNFGNTTCYPIWSYCFSTVFYDFWLANFSFCANFFTDFDVEASDFSDAFFRFYNIFLAIFVSFYCGFILLFFSFYDDFFNF